MRQNAAQLNRMQIREQEALNRQRRVQDDAAARGEEQAVRRTQAQYSHVASHGYGRGGSARSGDTPPTVSAGASSSRGAAGGVGGRAGAGRSSLNAGVAPGEDVEITVYVRECDDAAAQAFTYKESGSAGAARVPRGSGGPSAAAAVPGGRHVVSGGATRGPGAGGGGGAAAAPPSSSKPDSVLAPNRARVPRYLQQRKAEMAAEKEAVEAEAARQRQLSQIPPGHRRVSEDEKADTLRRLDERQQELEAQLAKIPIRFDTQSIQQRRRAIENELRELEAKRSKYATKNILYVPLSEGGGAASQRSP
ncbi:hypothetical protein ABB37_09607 [Leptomonas pyrrhocoris]|uniref:Enkurin domain-containing protein n=1 Tax=Leptomonas pyrrhocoris TaxID=157538 RepID=A0A0M9FPX7_LEPPY|nr:hypothetical protein ABB37_09607 [Leptomonas pyrrhocoris]KPA73670.1 hypothetical protein ABB37_09607 [Leptomonas pyrrhocoris]|eukprot:XP_015652109.1 hypothetical protein ABB37_09607 [Leptomonas pyrrhocoris]